MTTQFFPDNLASIAQSIGMVESQPDMFVGGDGSRIHSHQAQSETLDYLRKIMDAYLGRLNPQPETQPAPPQPMPRTGGPSFLRPGYGHADELSGGNSSVTAEAYNNYVDPYADVREAAKKQALALLSQSHPWLFDNVRK